jgi:DNA mismatch repair protein MLH3
MREPKIPEIIPSSMFAYSSRRFETVNTNGFQSSQFTKSDLRNAMVLGQVDRKFIACVLTSRTDKDDDHCLISRKNSLVLIDQHAAHERVRVEKFMSELAYSDQAEDPASETRPRRRKVDPPALVLLTTYEAERLAGNSELQDALSMWGIELANLQSMLCQEEHSIIGYPSEQSRPTADKSSYTQIYIKSVPDLVGDKVNLTRFLSCTIDSNSFTAAFG